MISLFAAALAVLSVATTSAQTINVEQPKPYIEVRGTAKTTIEPNKIEVTILLSELPSKGKITLSDQETQLATALTEAGVDLQNQLAVISQSKSGDKRKASYQYKNYLLTLTSGEELSGVFAAFDAHGVQNARVTRVTNDSQDETKMKMRAQAMKNARAIAETLAGAVGQKIDDAILITDISGGSDYYPNDYAMMRAAPKAAMETSMPTTIQMRPIEIEQSVSARFILMPRLPFVSAK